MAFGNWTFEAARIHSRRCLYELNYDSDVGRYTGDEAYASVEAAETFIYNYRVYKKNGFGRWLMFAKDTNEFIGWCGLKLVDGEVDLGYRLLKKHWNKGYASEASSACLDYGFNYLNLKRIIAKADKDKKASIRVMQKVGMTFEKSEVVILSTAPFIT